MQMSKIVRIGVAIGIVIATMLLGACQKPEIVPPVGPTTPTPQVTPVKPSSPTPQVTPVKPSSPTPGVATEEILGIHTTGATGEERIIVVFADFPDVERQYPVTQIYDRVVRLVGDYFRVASYNKMRFKGEMTKRYLLPYPVSHYKISAANLEVDPTRVLSLVEDVADAADNDVDFSEDFFVVIALGVTHDEYGMVGLCAIPGMLGWSSKSVIH